MQQDIDHSMATVPSRATDDVALDEATLLARGLPTVATMLLVHRRGAGPQVAADVIECGAITGQDTAPCRLLAQDVARLQLQRLARTDIHV